MKLRHLVLLLLAACANNPAETPDPTDADAIYTLTVARLTADSVPEIITQRPISVAEERALLAARLIDQAADATGIARVESALSEGGSCDTSPSFLMIYDDWNYRGNVLCLVGSGSAHFSQFFHHFEVLRDQFGARQYVPVSWAGQARSAFGDGVLAYFYQDGSTNDVGVLDAYHPYYSFFAWTNFMAYYAFLDAWLYTTADSVDVWVAR